ncbi:NAD-dependent epimerase/dehydratase family protein [Stenotrophomonas sp. ESTM1D_MKCIP4_1]|nr:NAD-dependent epimerase/dehydratase family protein [Stenotrophomonas sp. ESTM1D_MKCIP4_1]
MSQILIVGAAGNVGRALVQQASARGHRVLGCTAHRNRLPN